MSKGVQKTHRMGRIFATRLDMQRLAELKKGGEGVGGGVENADEFMTWPRSSVDLSRAGCHVGVSSQTTAAAESARGPSWPRTDFAFFSPPHAAR